MKPFSKLRDLLESLEQISSNKWDKSTWIKLPPKDEFIAEAHSALPRVLEALDIALKIVKVWDNLGDEQATETLIKIKELGKA